MKGTCILTREWRVEPRMMMGNYTDTTKLPNGKCMYNSDSHRKQCHCNCASVPSRWALSMET
jgi:hypothetical protein